MSSEKDKPKPPARSDPLKPRETTYTFFGFVDGIMQASVDEARQRLAQTQKRLAQIRAKGKEPRD